MARLRWRAIAVAMLCALLAGCSGNGSGNDPVTAKRATAVPKTAGVVKMAVATAPRFDPAFANEASSAELTVLDLLFDGLVGWNIETKSVRPSLAKSWSASSDGLTWTFVLDPDARFSNGRAITSGDVKWSLERLVARGQNLLSGAALTGARFDATDPARVVIALTKPFAALPELLSSPVFGIVPQENTDPSVLVTSSDYVVDGRSSDALTLRRLHPVALGFDGVEIHFAADAVSAYDQLKAGDVQLAPLPAAAEPVAGVATLDAGEAASYFYGINVASPVFADQRIRRAVLQAIDRTAIQTKFFAGVAEANTSLAPPSSTAAQDVCGARCSFDPNAAKASVAAALAGAPPPLIHLDFYEEPTGKEAGVAQAIADALTRIGLTVELRPHAFDEYKSFVASGKAELFRFGWVATYPSPEAVLTPLFASDGSDNVFGLKDAEADRLLAEARRTADPAVRSAAYRAAEDRIVSLAPVIPLVHYRALYAVSTAIHGLQMDARGVIDLD